MYFISILHTPSTPCTDFPGSTVNTGMVLRSQAAPDALQAGSWQSLTRLFSAAAAASDPLDPFHSIQMRLDVAWDAWASQHLFKRFLSLKLSLLAVFSSPLSFPACRLTTHFAVVTHFSILLTFNPTFHST